MQHSSGTDRGNAGTTPTGDADSAIGAERASRVTIALDGIVTTFVRIRTRYIDLTDAAKARVRPVGETLRRGQLRFLAGTDRWKERAAVLPRELRRLVREPDDVEQVRRRLGGVGIALFALLAIGSLAVLKPTGRSADRDASAPPPSGAATTSGTPDSSVPSTRPVATTSPSTTIPGPVATSESEPSVRRSGPRAVVPPPAGPAVVAATNPAAGAVTSPPSPPAPGTDARPVTRPTSSTSPATSSTTLAASTPSTAAPGNATTTVPTGNPAPPSTSAPILTFDLARGGDRFGGAVCLFGIDLLGGGRCTRSG